MVAARHTLSFPAIGRVATALIARGAPALIAAPASAADAGVLPVQGWVGAWLHPVAWGPDAPDLDPSVGQDLGDHPHVCAVLLLVLLRELFIRDVDARVEEEEESCAHPPRLIQHVAKLRHPTARPR